MGSIRGFGGATAPDLTLLLLSVFGGGLGRPPRVVPPLADLHESLTAPDQLVVKDGARVRGDVDAPRVVLGNRVRIDGSLRAGTLRAGRELAIRGKLDVAGRASFAGGVHVAPPEAQPAPVQLAGVRLDVPTRHADALLAAFRAVGWDARDTGATITTEDEEDALTTLVLDVRLPVPPGELVAVPPEPAAAPAPLRQPAAPPAPSTAEAYVRGAVLAVGDLVVGEGVEAELDLAATGDVTVGREAVLSGRVRAGGDLVLADGAVVGDASCGGRLTLGENARVTGSVEAARGLGPGSRVR